MDERDELAVIVGRLVRRVQALRDARRDRDGDERAQASLHRPEHPHQVRERAAVHVLHHEEVRVVDLAEILDVHDVRVIDARRDQRLVEEHPHQPLVLAVARWIT
jgi:hypothetical protein